jgi:hypothetical protein
MVHGDIVTRQEHHGHGNIVNGNIVSKFVNGESQLGCREPKLGTLKHIICGYDMLYPSKLHNLWLCNTFSFKIMLFAAMPFFPFKTRHLQL